MRAPRSGFPSLPLALATLTLLCGPATAACTGSGPTAPDSIDLGVVSSTARSAPNVPGPDAFNLTAESSPDVRLPTTTIVGGTLRLTAANGDVLTATYTGQVTITARSSDASLDLQVTGGSGQFQGATGTLRGDGTGAFAGEGTFSLVLKGSLNLTGKPGASNFRAHVLGAAFVSCLDERIWVALEGDGNSNRSGNVTATFRHQVTNSFCAA